MIPFCEAAFHPEYKRLGSIVGHGKLKAEYWDSWARIVAKYGWKTILRAADQVEPDKRWPSQTEVACAAIKASEDQAEIEAKNRERMASQPVVKDRKQVALTFQQIRERVLGKREADAQRNAEMMVGEK